MRRHRRRASADLAALGMYLEATDNYVTLHGQPHNQTAGEAVAPGLACIAAVALQVKYSGIFQLSCHAGFSGDTTANAIVHQLVTIPFANPPGTFFANGTGAGWISRDISNPSTAINYNQMANADYHAVAANGITFNGVPVNSGAAGAILQYSKADLTLTGLLTGSVVAIPATIISGNVFSFEGIVANALSNRTPFTPALSWVVAGLSVQSLHSVAAGVTNYQDLKLTMQELAFQ